MADKYTQVSLKLHREKDDDIIAFLSHQRNKNGVIKKSIRSHMAREAIESGEIELTVSSSSGTKKYFYKFANEDEMDAIIRSLKEKYRIEAEHDITLTARVTVEKNGTQVYMQELVTERGIL